MRFPKSLRVVVMLAPMALSAALAAQTPAPFPKPAQPGQNPPPRTPPAPPSGAKPAQPTTADPSEATLGVPIYPSAQFVASYDAGQGQRYYLFGSETDFLQVVTYYRNILKQRGELVFEEPPVHMFDIGRFREETMAFPPSVTVKDYTWGESKGYLNPKRGAKPERFKTIIQVVPVPAGTPK
jgi:hypothetical protein